MGRVGFLGPRGTYSEEALALLPQVATLKSVPLPTLLDVVLAAAEGRVDWAVVPVENSIEGSVDLTLDLLREEDGLSVLGEAVLPVRHALLVHPDQGEEPLVRVLSHPQALAQCRHTVRRLLPGAVLVPASSTANAARRVRKHGPGWAAIASLKAGAVFGLRVWAENVADVADNLTRFWLLGRGRSEPTGWDKTSLAFMLPEDRPGALHAVLGEFATRNLNLSRVETRPARIRLGSYYFFLDVLGHAEDPLVAEALQAVREKTAWLRVLGAYPAAHPPPPGGREA